MSNLIKITFLGILILCISCQSPNGQKERFLKTTATEIEMSLDSILNVFDQATSDFQGGIQKEVILEKYRPTIKKLKAKLNEALKKPTEELEGEQSLTDQEYETWIKQFDLSKIKNRAEELEVAGIDFEKIVATHGFDLKQLYSDSLRDISIRFPESWSITPDYDQQAFMAIGGLPMDSKQQNNNGVAIGLGISSVSSTTTASQYSSINLANLKTSTEQLNVLEEAAIELNGKQGKYVAISFITNGTKVVSTQVYLVENEQGYILNGSVIAEDFEKFRGLFLEIAGTLRVE